MRKVPRLFLLAALVAVLAAGYCAVLRFAAYRYQGRTERDWILSLAEYPKGNWAALGPDAVPILARALGEGTGPLDRGYQSFWNKLPMRWKKRLTRPANMAGIRRNASLALRGLTCDISGAVPALGRALHDEDTEVRANAAMCLQERLPLSGAAKADILPDLLRAMRDTDHRVRESVTQCLGSYPEQSRVVAPVVARALDDSLDFDRYLAVLSLKRMDPGEAAKGGTGPILLHCLTNSEMLVRVNAAEFLSSMRSDPAREVPAFTEMLDAYPPAAQYAAAQALGNYGADALPAVPALRHALATGEPRVRLAASNALVRIGVPAETGDFAASTNRFEQ